MVRPGDTGATGWANSVDAVVAPIRDGVIPDGYLLAKSGAAVSGLDPATFAREDDVAPVTFGSIYTAPHPIITFIDDDGDPLWYDVWGVVAAAKGVSISLAAIAGRVSGAIVVPGYPSLTLVQLQAIRAAGHDVLNHSWSHPDSNSTATADLQTDWTTGKTWFETNWPDNTEAQQVLVYPGGLTNALVDKKGVARGLFRYGISSSSSYNTAPVDNWSVQRINGDTLTEAQIDAFIDQTVAANGWLIVMTHDKELDAGGRAANITKLENVIDYARASGVDILKWTDAEKIKGNAVAIGEYTDKGNATFIARGGKRSSASIQGMWTPRLYGSTTAGAHTYSQQKGYYQVTDGLITLKASISIPSAGYDATMAGNLRIDGLPAAYLPNSLDVAAVAPCSINIFNLGANYSVVFAKATGAYLTLLRDGNNVAEAYLTSAQVVAGQTLNLVFTMTYMLPGFGWV